MRRNAHIYIFQTPHSISTEHPGSSDIYINMVELKVVWLYDAEVERNCWTVDQRVRHIYDLVSAQVSNGFSHILHHIIGQLLFPPY